MSVASGFSLLWEHSSRAPGRRTRGPATNPSFRPFCGWGRSLSLLFRQVWSRASLGAEPKSRRCRYPGATDGRHGRCRAKGCPQIGSQPMQQGYTHPLQGLLRRRLWPERAKAYIVTHVLRRCYCADTSDSLRCDARSTRARRRTTATTPHTHRAHRMRILDARRCLASRTSAGVGGVSSSHSESSRPRLRPRYSQRSSLPSAFGVA